MSTSLARNAKRAASGAYGARPYDATQERAIALLASIREELHGADFFQREDLLQLRCFQDVATITRYRYCGEAVHRLIEMGKLVAKSRTDLCLPAKQGSYDTQAEMTLTDRYTRQVQRLIANRLKLDPGKPFTVADLLQAWARADQHMSTNTKRIAVREVLRQMVRHNELKRQGYSYTQVEG